MIGAPWETLGLLSFFIGHMTQKTNAPVLADPVTEFKDNVDSALIIQKQHIDDGLLQYLADVRLASNSRREGEFMLACSVPTIIHEQWLREGFDMTREPASKVIARLKAKGLDAFIATNKRV